MPAHFIGFSGTGKPLSQNQLPVVATVGAAVTPTVGAAVATTAATNASPYGYAQAQADALVANVNTLRTDVLALATLANALRSDVRNLTTLANQLRADLVDLGFIKGSA
jgi:hypothetical protein